MIQGSAQSEYSKLESIRSAFLERARDCSRLTLPTLIPDEGSTTDKRFPTPFQSVGARGVNNLASTLLLSLLPPNAPFFRLLVDETALRKMQSMDPQIKAEVEKSMSQRERLIMREIEAQAIRVATFEAIKHLIVAGNVGLYFPTDGGSMRVIRLDRYVVKRCPSGCVDKVIIRESISPSMLPPGLNLEKSAFDQPYLDLFTCIRSVGDGKVEVFQEVKGQIIPDSITIVDKSKSPFIPLRMIRIDGEDYGRGYVEQYLGDLKSLEALMQVIVEGSAAMAKILILVAPNGSTRAATLAKAPNGAIREGSAADVTVLQANKAADLSVGLQMINQITERLSYAFMLTEASIRNAERVTAEEIRLVTQSIERQLGGVYSLLSLEFQLPLVNKIMEQMERSKKLPKLPRKFVTPTIITGIDALGRGNDLQRLDLYLQGIGQMVGPEALSGTINIREYMNRRAAALGIETEGLVKTEDQIMAERQAALQQQYMQQMASPAAQAGLQMYLNQSQQAQQG
jgi:hypothetical protein